MSCLCENCIAEYLETLSKKVFEEVKAEKEREAWEKERDATGL